MMIVTDLPVSVPPPTAGIHSRPGDLVDSITRSGSFVFLGDLFVTDRLFELCDFRISRVMSKCENIHLVLDLSDKYPLDSLTTHILDVVV